MGRGDLTSWVVVCDDGDEGGDSNENTGGFSGSLIGNGCSGCIRAELADCSVLSLVRFFVGPNLRVSRPSIFLCSLNLCKNSWTFACSAVDLI